MWGSSGERDLKEGSALCWLMMLMSDLFSFCKWKQNKSKRQYNIAIVSIILVEKKKFSVDETITAFSPKMQVLCRNLIIGFWWIFRQDGGFMWYLDRLINWSYQEIDLIWFDFCFCFCLCFLFSNWKPLARFWSKKYKNL